MRRGRTSGSTGAGAHELFILRPVPLRQPGEPCRLSRRALPQGSRLKAYLDNNVVSSIAKDDTPSESDAIDALMAAYDKGEVDLVTSELTLDEIRNYRGPHRKRVERTFRLLEKVPLVRWDELLGIHSYGDKYTWISSPMIQNDSLYDALLKAGLSVIDAQHVFVAAKQACTVFLTCDGVILARCADIDRLCGLRVRKPSAFVAEQGW